MRHLFPTRILIATRIPIVLVTRLRFCKLAKVQHGEAVIMKWLSYDSDLGGGCQPNPGPFKLGWLMHIHPTNGHT